ncbi:serine hydrolase [Embleya sp. NBC_00896]|uniref:serine hydrolase n=1 Tax=Embleya sp. NBC_00896 TaxID=2975961 RepID=UPI00386985F2|nr:class A beta-lactamase-related serine hydrolase [Embleya sp. NBC_00896]
MDILATLLLRAQDEKRPLTADEKAKASVMIRASDNAATWALWDAIGKADGLSVANARLGLVETVATPVSWGLTRTTPADQLRLLDAVTSKESVLSVASRSYLLELMNSVRADQAWGVSVVADSGKDTALKNGWLPRDATGLWVVNSVGRVVHKGRTLLVAVLSDDQVSMPVGIDLIEEVVEAAIPAATRALG